MANITDGGPAFPITNEYGTMHGMSLRDFFAANVQADDRLVKVVRAMDDKALEIFALHPDCEREEHIAEIEFTDWFALPNEVAKVARRLELEARAIARVRYMQADAMLRARATVSPYDRDTARACRGAQSPAERQADHLKEFGDKR